MTVRYVAREGSSIKNEDAEIIAERIEQIAAAHELVLPEDVVEDARNAHSPLHGYFEWDNAEAAEKYRLTQARYYLRSIDIIREEDERPVRAFHSIVIKTDKVAHRGYTTFRIAVSNRELWEQVLEQERARLIACQQNLRRYKELEAVAVGPLQEAIEALSTISAGG